MNTHSHSQKYTLNILVVIAFLIYSAVIILMGLLQGDEVITITQISSVK